jgi:hypothetical protein
MKLTNTKNQVKTLGADIKEVGKSSAKLVKDTFGIFPSLGKDFRQHRAMMKAFREWRDAQDSPDASPLD